MRVHHLVVPTVLVLLTAAGSAQAAAKPASTSFSVRQILTPQTELRGSVRFTVPTGWKATTDPTRHSSARFEIPGPDGCRIDVSVDLRGKTTRSSVRNQIRGSVGDAPLGHGTRPGGAWGTTGPTISGGEGAADLTGLYGIAPVRVQAKRYGQVRVGAVVHRCDLSTPGIAELLAADGRFVTQVNRVLATARLDVRVVRVERR